MPEVPGPEGLRDLFDIPAENLESAPLKMRRFLTEKRPFEFRPVEHISFTEPVTQAPVKHCWIRAVDSLPDDLALHQNLLAYISDYELLGASVLPHGLVFGSGSVIMASLDHGLWFHRRLRVDQWLLYAIDSPNAAGARGFSRGQLFTADGVLVASTAQEGLIRVIDPQSRKSRSDPRLQV
jgi:acyl-CoA thioesterase-2